MFLNSRISAPASARIERSTALAVAAPLAAAAVGVWWDGGYSPGAKLWFGIAALAAVAGPLVLDRRRVAGMAREPVVIVLLALAAAGALSALWTIGPVDSALRWALVTAGYGTVALAAATATRRRGGVEALAAGVAVLAGTAGAFGLAAQVGEVGPYAQRIAGVWRPGGPFEYAPALALLQVSALPALAAGMTARSRLLAAAAATGMALAGAVLALAASRLSLALAIAVAGIAIALPGVRATRATVVAAFGMAVAAAVAMQAAAGGRRPAADQGLHVTGLIALVTMAVLAPPVWLALRGATARLESRPRLPRPRLMAAGVLVAALVSGSLAYGGAAGRGGGPEAGFLHGRTNTWRAAVETFADRPIAGTGSDAFLTGSARHQGGQTILFAHDLPLELAAELGVAGIGLALALYAAAGRLLWRARRTRAAWLLGPAAAAFLIASLVDWPWHLSGAGAVWSIGLGALAGAAAPAPKLSPRHPRA